MFVCLYHTNLYINSKTTGIHLAVMLRSIPRALLKSFETTTNQIRIDPDSRPPLKIQQVAAVTNKDEVPKQQQRMTFRQRMANLKNMPDHYKMLFLVQGIFMMGVLYVRINIHLEAILKEEKQRLAVKQLEREESLRLENKVEETKKA